MNITGNCVVSIHYTLTNSDGEVLDSSQGGEPLRYLHNAGGLIPGLERELEGKVAGDQFNVTVQPEDAYGELNPELIQMVPESAFQGVEKVEPGMQFQAQDEAGNVRSVTVQDVSEEGVLVNANHPLAGVELTFDVTVADVREATPEEIDHGHVH